MLLWEWLIFVVPRRRRLHDDRQRGFSFLLPVLQLVWGDFFFVVVETEALMIRVDLKVLWLLRVTLISAAEQQLD